MKIKFKEPIEFDIWFDVEKMLDLYRESRELIPSTNIRGDPGFRREHYMLVLLKVKKAWTKPQVLIYWQYPPYEHEERVLIATLTFVSRTSRQLWWDWYSTHKKVFSTWLINTFKEYMKKAWEMMDDEDV